MRVRRNSEESNWQKKFGDKLRRMIHIKGITQGQLAEELGVSDVVVSRYITGTYSPSIYRLKEIARILDCDINCLLDVDE